MPITPLTCQILMALADADRHGYGIIKEIGARLGRELEPSTGALYLALQRMEAGGLIRDVPAPAEETDGRRRYYRITPAGRRAVAAEARRLSTLVAAARAKNLLPAAGGEA
jgi:DNA-binding PadR family transcriptional regulator